MVPTLFYVILIKLLKKHSRYKKNWALKILVFRRHFSKILIVLQSKTSNYLIIITNINFRYICKNIIYGYENNNHIILCDY